MEEELKYIFRNWTTKIIKYVISLLILSLCCINSINYESILHKQIKMQSNDTISQLQKEKVIILGYDFTFVDVTKINGVDVADIIISEEVVKDAKTRFFIAHLIRNICIEDAVIYNYDETGNNFRMYPRFDIDNAFILENKNDICNVIYFIVHKGYFNLYEKPGAGFDKFFVSPKLKIISYDMQKLQKRLIDENAFFPIDVEITGLFSKGDKEKLKSEDKQEKQSLPDMQNKPPKHPDYKPPKNWNGGKERNPNGDGTGWSAKNGNVWVPTDHNGTHSPHWDVQKPGGKYEPKYPLD